MIKKYFIDQLNQGLTQLIAHNPLKDLEKNLQLLLTGILSKMHLVSREEFIIQQKILINTREKLTALELRIKEISD